MIRIIFCLLLLFSTTVTAADNPRVLMQTTMGDMVIELYADKAPITVKNFLQYVKDGFYNGTIFHRVIYDWLIQGGGYDQNLQAKETRPPIKNEAANGLKNTRGTIAMARFTDPDSADSQFFINLDNNTSFNHKGNSRRTYGYCVFGRVVKGLKVAEAISAVDTKEKQGFVNLPAKPVVINYMKIISGD